jgi:hypothetical protein
MILDSYRKVIPLEIRSKKVLLRLRTPLIFIFFITAFYFLFSIDHSTQENTLQITNKNDILNSGQPLSMPGLSQTAGPLRVDPYNPRYFMDGSGKAVVLVGSHTWDNLQDMASSDFDWIKYLNDLTSWGHNFIRLWVWESPTPNAAANLVAVGPMFPEIWLRKGPEYANDGGLKFDLTQYNQEHFDRLRQRIIEAGNHGIYVSIMLFNGWSVAQKTGWADPWPYHPFNAANNINGIDGDPNHDGNGYETQNGSNSNITDLQDAYVRHVIDTVNDLDNVLYEIANEPDGTINGTIGWVNHMINYIQNYEAGKSKQHPVWFTVPWPGGNNSVLLASNAEAISPNSDVNNNGTKVVIPDTDHYFGVGGDADWAWKEFTRGVGGIAYMDCWKNQYLDCSDLGDPDQNFRNNLGYIRYYSNLINLENMAPHGELSSTGYALANPSATNGEILVYLPSGGALTVNLTSMPGSLYGEWLNPQTGNITLANPIAGGSWVTLNPPFVGNAVLYIKQYKLPPNFKQYIPCVLINKKK